METPNRILHTVVASLAAAAFFIFTACTAAPQADIYTTTATADRLFDHTRQALESRSRDTLPAQPHQMRAQPHRRYRHGVPEISGTHSAEGRTWPHRRPPHAAKLGAHTSPACKTCTEAVISRKNIIFAIVKTANTMNAITRTDFTFEGQRGKYTGKVRDVYDIDDRYLVMVVTDRISAFDVVLPEGIPYKGQVLNQIAAKFLDATADILPNWKIAVPDPMVTVGRKCEPFKVEMVIRGYLSGHAWREYKAGKRTICGVAMPEGMVERQPFPGPGLGVRCLGAITRDRLEALREADAILREEFAEAGLAGKVWQYFVVVPDMRATGVRDGKRAYDWPAIIRAVNTVDAMTATVPELDWALLKRITDRILAEVPGICRVTYDLTPKPVGTIEWE